MRQLLMIYIDMKHWVCHVIIHNDGTETHEYIYEKCEPPLDMLQHDECTRRSQLSQLQSSKVQTISMDELTKFGVTLDNQLTLLTICNDGSRVSSVRDID